MEKAQTTLSEEDKKAIPEEFWTLLREVAEDLRETGSDIPESVRELFFSVLFENQAVDPTALQNAGLSPDLQQDALSLLQYADDNEACRAMLESVFQEIFGKETSREWRKNTPRRRESRRRDSRSKGKEQPDEV